MTPTPHLSHSSCEVVFIMHSCFCLLKPSHAAGCCSSGLWRSQLSLSVSKQSLVRWWAGAALLAVSSQSEAAGVFGQVEPCCQGAEHIKAVWVCACMRVSMGVCVCVWCAHSMMSPWAAVELMRQQALVSCQCHPEGDVSKHGCLPFSLFLITPNPHHTPS